MNKKKLILYTVVLLFTATGVGFPSLAQETRKAPYYVSLNTGTGGRIHEISDESLSIQYHDAYGRWKEIPLKIYNWKRQLVTTLSLDKTFGLNSYVFDLKSVYGAWELNQIYTCELKDESGHKYELPIRLIPPPAELAPEVSIIVDPEQVDCEELSFNLVKFYGDIRGGKAPYTVNWFVLNEHRTDFLYQPREEIIEKPGKTMVIAVDKNPDYYVVLQVKDACGNVKESIVNLVCEQGRKKINTIFVEELNIPLIKSRTGQ